MKGLVLCKCHVSVWLRVKGFGVVYLSCQCDVPLSQGPQSDAAFMDKCCGPSVVFTSI